MPKESASVVQIRDVKILWAAIVAFVQEVTDQEVQGGRVKVRCRNINASHILNVFYLRKINLYLAADFRKKF